MSKPKCFVIMPYGSSDPKKRQHYLGVYASIIKPAAETAGYEVNRSDISAAPGNITNDIIHDLATADIVIADLTEGNANVFFELGIRHVLRKSGTVHIVDKNHPIPFDIHQYRAVEYSTELAEIPEVLDSIMQAIQLRQKEPTRSDNPVHDAIPSLPIDVRTTGDVALRKQIEDLEKNLEALRLENEKLLRRLAIIDPGGTLDHTNQDLDIDAILNEADQIRQYSGENLLLRLATAGENSVDAFLEELRAVLRSPYLTRYDFLQIRRLCSNLDLEEYSQATLEIARQMYPEDTDIMVKLADAYQNSPNPTLRARGRLMVENFLAIEHGTTGPKLSRRPFGDTNSAAITLINFYASENRHEWIISLTTSLEENLGAQNLFIRNKARALHKMGQTQNAEEEFKRGISLDPVDDTIHAFYADFLDDMGRFEEEFEEFEKAIIGDPRDGTRFMSLADHIYLRGYVRDKTGQLIGPVPVTERVRHAVPLYIRGLNDDYRNLRNRVINALISRKLNKEAQAVGNGEIPQGDYDETSLQYVENLIKIREDESQ